MFVFSAIFVADTKMIFRYDFVAPLTKLRNIIIDLLNSDTWIIQLTIAINFISSKDAEEERVMHSRSDNIKFAFYNDANEVVD